MIPILSREQMRAYDARAIEGCAVPGVVLMENAGRGAADHVAQLYDRHAAGAAGGRPGPVVIACGRGNNGGDGFVVARHLLARGIEVEALLIGEREQVGGDARLNLEALLGLGGQVHTLGADLTVLREALGRAGLAVDALFGTGLSRPLEGGWLEVVTAFDEARCPKVAIDIPTGIDANSGAVLGAAVHADLTVTFAHLKAGLVQGAGLIHAGEVQVVGLGIPDRAILDEVGWLATVTEQTDVVDALGRRALDCHKYRAGSVLVVAGSEGKTGAALLAARGVLRAGGGLVTVASWPAAIDSIESRVVEVMTARLDPADLEQTLVAALDRKTAVAIGPGLGLDERAQRLSDEIVLGWRGPVVVDADSLTHFAGRAEALREAQGERVLTPHAGELGRLLGIGSAEVEAQRIDTARRAAELSGATVVLKGPRTVVASDGGDRVSVCAAGNPALATGGSGDVLTGIVAALLCHAPTHEAASAAVWLHGRAADRWAARVGADRGMLATEIADELPALVATLPATG